VLDRLGLRASIPTMTHATRDRLPRGHVQVAATRERHGYGRHSLWTGDVGTALYLRECLTGGAAVPTIGRW
jgi:hypothetical protein